jgi:hypothetical protein
LERDYFIMLLPLKLLMTPILIATVTLVGRKWGPGVSGWLMGFPLTSGPVSLILMLQYGKDFAERAAVGTLGGQASVCVFCLTYCLIAPFASWPISAAVSIGAFFLSVLCWNVIVLPLVPTFLVTILIGALILRLIPRRVAAIESVQAPGWDLPARMVAAASFVLLLTTLAQAMGPHLSGLISPFPVFGVVIAAFTHHQQGPAAASQLLRGVVLGSFAFACFFLAVGILLPGVSPVGTYLGATAAAIAVNSLTLRFSRQQEQPAVQ